MIAVDTNILVYAHRRESSAHGRCKALLSTLATGNEPWAIAWPSVFEFFSVVTNPRIWKDEASTPAQAWGQLRAWMESPSIRLLGETEDFARVCERFMLRPRVRGAIAHDARIAALCLAHGVTRLYSRDRDFSLFPELKVENPLRET